MSLSLLIQLGVLSVRGQYLLLIYVLGATRAFFNTVTSSSFVFMCTVLWYYMLCSSIYSSILRFSMFQVVLLYVVVLLFSYFLNLDMILFSLLWRLCQSTSSVGE